MDSEQSIHLVPGTKTLTKRPSDNAIQERAAKRGTAVAANEVIEVGSDSSSGDGQIKKLEDRTRKRVYKDIGRRGENSKHSWGTCCECEAQGEIMTWPKCSQCLHNSCPTCQLGKTDYLDEEKNDSLDVSDAKVDELFGEIEMHVDHISSRGDLAAEPKEELEKFKSELANLRQDFKRAGLGIADK